MYLGCIDVLFLGLLKRPSNRVSKALRAFFQRWVQRAVPLPVGSRAMSSFFDAEPATISHYLKRATALLQQQAAPPRA
ncbi:hypothetical protein QE392_001349 [Microbacterium proteolyticum]|nr:hypothetical protein [Microbacterium sp. SORGH_AS_0344]MDQ1169545.1 hypothetical protein [Microbacterium proteolyticum]